MINNLPAALLTKSLFSTSNSYFWGLRVRLTNLMATMILTTQTKVSITTINQAMSYLGYIPRCLGTLGWSRQRWRFHQPDKSLCCWTLHWIQFSLATSKLRFESQTPKIYIYIYITCYIKWIFFNCFSILSS